MFRKALIAFRLMLVSGVLFLVEDFGVLLINPRARRRSILHAQGRSIIVAVVGI